MFDVYDTHLKVNSNHGHLQPEIEPIRIDLELAVSTKGVEYQVISNEYHPLSEMSFDSPIRGGLDFIFDAFITANDNRSRCKPTY